jgi:hypothetical protein
MRLDPAGPSRAYVSPKKRSNRAGETKTPPNASRAVMIENADQRVVFENPKVEFPTRILYWLGKEGDLHGRIEGAPGGTPKSKEWIWKKRR